MHATSFIKMALFRQTYLKGREKDPLVVLDLGSMNVNGCYRPLFDTLNWKYLGLDLAAGANVDIVLANPNCWDEVPSGSMDVVISGQAFEHIQFFWLSMIEVARVLNPNGICCIQAPAGGYEHRYPTDCWRFYPDGARAMADWVGLRVVEAWTDWDFEWQDTVLIARKPQDWRLAPELEALRRNPVGYASRSRDLSDPTPTEPLLLRAYEQATGKWLNSGKAQTRNARSVLRPPLLTTFQAGVSRYSYRGRLCQKSPIDLALYSKLIWENRPATIVELGSLHGGSALWLADITRTYGLNTKIVSADIRPVTDLNDERIVFMQADAAALDRSALASLLPSLKRPWIVIEDASHQYQATLAAMRYFGAILQPGEYMVVEDGILDELGWREQFGGGPNRAIHEFLAEQQGRFVIDETYCDYFGHNLTYNTNGYLKRV